jgi:hypothetical protein
MVTTTATTAATTARPQLELNAARIFCAPNSQPRYALPGCPILATHLFSLPGWGFAYGGANTNLGVLYQGSALAVPKMRPQK